MKEPSNDTATAGFNVFNRWGCFKPEFTTHPVEKGTGVWEPELNDGLFLLIESFSVQEEYQRLGYGRRQFEQVSAKAQHLVMQERKDRRNARNERLERSWKDNHTKWEKRAGIGNAFHYGKDKVLKPDEKESSGYNFAVVWVSIVNNQDIKLEARKLSLLSGSTSIRRNRTFERTFGEAWDFGISAPARPPALQRTQIIPLIHFCHRMITYPLLH